MFLPVGAPALDRRQQISERDRDYPNYEITKRLYERKG